MAKKSQKYTNDKNIVSDTGCKCVKNVESGKQLQAEKTLLLVSSLMLVK